MRLALAAMTSDKGDVERNLGRHVDLMEAAAADGCHLAVFPEFSLTGSVDPGRAPEDLLSLDAAPVHALAAATKSTGIGAVFGIAERGRGGPHITQVYARDGDLVGVQRKRHLGEDEDGYVVAGDDASFSFGSVAFAGRDLCRERHRSTMGGCRVGGSIPGAVLLRAGTVRPASRRGGMARRLRVVAGLRARRRPQAGRSPPAVGGHGDPSRVHPDEDFPGLAALVDPNGEVVARLPDWQPGTLMVDVPSG